MAFNLILPVKDYLPEKIVICNTLAWKPSVHSEAAEHAGHAPWNSLNFPQYALHFKLV